MTRPAAPRLTISDRELREFTTEGISDGRGEQIARELLRCRRALRKIVGLAWNHKTSAIPNVWAFDTAGKAMDIARAALSSPGRKRR